SFFEVNSEKHYIFGKGGGERLALELNTELLAQIPIGAANDTGDGIYDASTPQGQVYAHLAKTLGRKLDLGVMTGK
ncbi:MAG: MRP family ATP-binding protein, partial [Tumebacillaceae bacterium]